MLWFRRDLRLADHPALLAACREADDAGSPVVALFVIDPALWQPAGAPRRAWLLRSLHALNESIDGRLVIRCGDPREVVPQVAAQAGAAAVHITADAAPYGRARDQAVETALQAAGRELVRTGTPYAVGPGTLHNGSGGPYQVFTPFRTAWLRHGWPAPAPSAASAADAGRWAELPGEALPAAPELGELTLPEAGEQAALHRWRSFLTGDLADYASRRDLPATAGTSSMSAALKFGEIHPRTMLADLATLTGAECARSVEVFRSELAWREFYADVLWRQPESARSSLRPAFAAMRYDSPAGSGLVQARFEAWQQGRTGFPFVDAGMRQLQAEGWMHNRVRMVAASFLVKDLHLEWQHGARFFMRWLRDGDLASNNHGWQWVAGSGTDAAPYFRIFNPVTQGLRFDPDGDYVRRHIPELRGLHGPTAHEPWTHPRGYADGYPERIVEHAAEREESLRRLRELGVV